MAAQLWLLRHGEAVSHAADDASRELTPRGEEQARAAGRALAALGLAFGAVYTSPKLRARRTAELACESLGVQPIVHEPLRAGFTERDARELVATGENDNVLVVGHMPDLAEIVHDLTGARVELRTGGAAGVLGSNLIALLGPRELQEIGT